MKNCMKLFTGLFAAALLVFGMTGCSSESDSGHEHTFATTWSTDDDYHWHAATCSHTTEKSSYGVHNWVEGEGTTATCTTDGVKNSTCSVCSKTKTETITATGHDFSIWYNGTRRCNKCSIVETCSHPSYGSWDNGQRACTVCGMVETCSHSYGTYTSNNDATKTKDGTKTATCTVCEMKNTVTDEGSMLAVVVGDIVLSDGSIKSYDDYDRSQDTAVAVIVRARSSTEDALGMGLEASESLAWCQSSANGFEYISELDSLTDGSSGWSVLQAACSDATSDNAESLYPAWNYCLTYGEEKNLPDAVKGNWYLPSTTELALIGTNYTTIINSLIKTDHAFDSNWAYWTCNQSADIGDDMSACKMTISDSGASTGTYPKSMTFKVYPFRKF